MEEVGREAGEDVRTRWHFIKTFVRSGPQDSDRQIKALRLLDNGGIFTDRFIPSIHVTMPASGTYFRASVPQVPCDGFWRAGVCILLWKQAHLLHHGICPLLWINENAAVLFMIFLKRSATDGYDTN
jgi:hypothetical protein